MLVPSFNDFRDDRILTTSQICSRWMATDNMGQGPSCPGEHPLRREPKQHPVSTPKYRA